jgi:hypothetical protein
MVITESNEKALKYLIEKRENSSLVMDIYKPEDKPAVAGTLSFGYGRDFIRDNIVVEIYTGEIINEKTVTLAQQIDILITAGSVFNSLNELRPVIKDFKIANNPVLEGTKNLLTIKVTDPNEKEIYYHWDYNEVAGFGGFVISENDNYYFQANSVSTHVETNEQELIAIAINEYGFFTDSTIAITTTKE